MATDTTCTPYGITASDTKDRVWINAADGSCIGRFSKRFGIDVHTTLSEQLDGAPQCLYCTHHPATEADWQDFRRAMKQHHGVIIPDTLISF